MIGGAMLACAVGAMVLIAWWSLPRDDAEDQGTGLLALRDWSGRKVVQTQTKRGGRNRRPAPAAASAPGMAKVKANGKRDRRPDRSGRRRGRLS